MKIISTLKVFWQPIKLTLPIAHSQGAFQSASFISPMSLHRLRRLRTIKNGFCVFSKPNRGS